MNVRTRRRGRLRLRALAALAIGLALTLTAACEDRSPPIKISGPAQGTRYQVTITDAPEDLTAETVRDAINQVIDGIDRQMSGWRDDSQLSRFNDAAANTWVSVSPELAALTARALEIGRLTNGAFDVTLGPILKVWGFGPKGDVPTDVPTRATLDAAREKTGIGLIHVRTDPPALRKDEAGVTLDLAGLAQGYTVDRMAARLNELGATHYLVALGGELYARGKKTPSQPWRIGIEKPIAGARRIDRVVQLTDAGMTTSGDYRDFFEIDGHRFSHTIDPRTGRPVAHDLRAVTVIADDAMAADAMATALLVMGPEAGMRYANAHDIAALFVSGHPRAYNQGLSDAFDVYWQQKQ